ncbi:hypothetical protein AG0111_0g5979 [Alternaria gaisen]|uniref:Ig-like domain-containing protein n=2 Tax=Alternaria sect. Alternaria TaxID=2499237 RepID=A0AB37WZJ2_9PLEO|nr:hypothetical protein AG0111_0g5979 [Alternaria gaisen]RYN38907.1 hypothetical protein AA0115_g69 [Alternaria tenuissima]RYN70027.1 hypothetical protein AA0118_g317 [Alternaria tenuissima]
MQPGGYPPAPWPHRELYVYPSTPSPYLACAHGIPPSCRPVSSGSAPALAPVPASHVWYKPNKRLNVNKHQPTHYKTTAALDPNNM